MFTLLIENQILSIALTASVFLLLRYLLRHKPKWSEKLKAEFLLAFDKILQLLKTMQVNKLNVT